jgi:hypothetical protein
MGYCRRINGLRILFALSFRQSLSRNPLESIRLPRRLELTPHAFRTIIYSNESYTSSLYDS